jgi:hypothetical protein
MAHIDYSTDPLKHYVRKYGWLPACQEQAATIRKRIKKTPLRYFTFCAAEAIDVFLLEREKILTRSKQTGRLEGVYFCEKDEKAFGEIADLIGSPEQGFLGDFDRIILFEEDNDTRGKELYKETDEFYPEEVRKKLRFKDAHYRLQKNFPFDIINLDVCGVMFPLRKGVITPLLRSLIKILEWQTYSLFPNNRPCKQFTLFLTSHIDPDKTDQDAIEQLRNRVSENIDTSVEFRQAFSNRYGHQEAVRLSRDNFAEFFCLAFTKFIIHQALFTLGWKVTYRAIYLYNRDNKWNVGQKYQIMHSVSVYERIPGFGQRLDQAGITQYIQTATQVIKGGMKWVENIIQQSEIRQLLIQDLESIVEFRNQHRRP